MGQENIYFLENKLRELKVTALFCKINMFTCLLYVPDHLLDSSSFSGNLFTL